MSHLSGSLEGIGLSALLDFLTGVRTTGRLVIADADLCGSLDLDNGVLVGAALRQERGLPALESIALALADAQFELKPPEAQPEHNIALQADELQHALDLLMGEAERLADAVPNLQCVPRVVLDEDGSQSAMLLERDALRLLVRLDDRRTVAELAAEDGLTRTLRTLARLSELGIVRVEERQAQAGAEPVARPTASRAPETPTASPRQTANTRPAAKPAWSRWRRAGTAPG